MLLDLLFLREFYHRNRRFWYPLYVFHLGLYLLILWHAWLFIRSVVGGIETVSIFGWVWGTFSTLLTFIGGIAILIMRIKDEELKVYYPSIHYLKWIFLLLTLSWRGHCRGYPFSFKYARPFKVCERAGDLYRILNTNFTRLWHPPFIFCLLLCGWSTCPSVMSFNSFSDTITFFDGMMWQT